MEREKKERERVYGYKFFLIIEYSDNNKTQQIE